MCARANSFSVMTFALSTVLARISLCAQPAWQINPTFNTSSYKLHVAVNYPQLNLFIDTLNCTRHYRSNYLISEVEKGGEKTEDKGVKAKRKRTPYSELTEEKQAARKGAMRARKARKKEKARTQRAAEAIAKQGNAPPPAGKATHILPG